MKLLTYTNGIRIALFATFLLFASYNLSAQYKLELEWQKTPAGQAFNVRSLEITKDDSVIIVNGGELNNENRKFMKISASDGRILSTKDNAIVYNFMKLSKDNSFLVCGSEDNNSVDVYDFLTLEQRMSFKFPTMIIGTSFSEPQMKAVACGKSLIRVYDLNTKSLFKEFNSDYFKSSDVYLQDAKITDDGKYIVYGYLVSTKQANGNYITKYYLQIIDIDGKVIKTMDESSSAKFTFTVDGKTLIYFMPDKIHFLDITTLQEKEGIPKYGGMQPQHIEMSNDDKSMLIGAGLALLYFDLDTKNSFYLNENSDWDKFVMNSKNSSLFYGSSRSIYKFNLTPNTSIIDLQNKLDLSLNLFDNKLILTNHQNHQINTLTAYDILGRTYPLSANGNEVDVSGLVAGRYFLKVGLADGSFLDFGFVVE